MMPLDTENCESAEETAPLYPSHSFITLKVIEREGRGELCNFESLSRFEARISRFFR